MTVIDARTLWQLLRIRDLDECRFAALLDIAAVFKREPLARAGALAGRSVGCSFAGPSMGTRFPFAAAIHRLGALPVMLRPDELELGGGEGIADAARVLSSYCDALVVGTCAHADVVELAAHSAAPVINALTDEHHPCQALADCLTLRERFGRLDRVELAYVGDGNNVCHSLIESAALTGLRLRVACSPGCEPDPAIVAAAGDAVTVYDDPEEAACGARAVYTDVWTPPGQEDHAARGRAPFARYRVTPALMRFAARDAIFLHCLPAHRGEEVDAVVIDGPRSAVWQQAANRLPVVQALLYVLVTQDWEV
jgi:ornithine carbamoyltransferase